MMGEIIEISDKNETKIMENVYAITTPGHTNGHISFVVKSDHGTILIAGDSLTSMYWYVANASTKTLNSNVFSQKVCILIPGEPPSGSPKCKKSLSPSRKNPLTTFT